MASKPKTTEKPEAPKADLYSVIAPEDIEYFSTDESTVPEGSDTCALVVRFSVVPGKLLRILAAEENARFMTADQMRRLSDNLAKDDALTSVVCVYPEKESGKLAVLSGNHRVEAALKAGQELIPVLVIQTHIGMERRRAIQLSHNAINGQDDPNLLKHIYENLSLEYKAYSGLTDDHFKSLDKLDIDGLSIGAPQYEEISFLFLPNEKELFLQQIKDLEKAKDKRTVLFAAYDDYFRLFDALVAVKQFKNVFNNAVAIRLLADLAMERLEQLKAATEAEKANGEQREVHGGASGSGA